MEEDIKNRQARCERGLRPARTSLLFVRRDAFSTAILMGVVFGSPALWPADVGEAQEPGAAGELPFAVPYAFVDRFTDSPDVKALGFPIGPKPFLNLGMVVEKEEAEKAGVNLDIVKATATNGKVHIDLTHQDIGILDLWDNFEGAIPEFDPKKHLGEWVIQALDSEGRSASTRPVLLEHGIEMPLVQNMNVEKAESGDLTVTWAAPELDPEIQEKCDVDYRLRLLQDVSKQLYRSDRTTETVITVPADTLKGKVGETFDGVWARVEMACRDKEQKDDEGVGELEARSNTFVPLT